MIVSILRAIGVIVSATSTTVYSAIDLAQTFTATIWPSDISFRSWLENGSLIFTSTLRDSNGSL